MVLIYKFKNKFDLQDQPWFYKSSKLFLKLIFNPNLLFTKPKYDFNFFIISTDLQLLLDFNIFLYNIKWNKNISNIQKALDQIQ